VVFRAPRIPPVRSSRAVGTAVTSARSRRDEPSADAKGWELGMTIRPRSVLVTSSGCMSHHLVVSARPGHGFFAEVDFVFRGTSSGGRDGGRKDVQWPLDRHPTRARLATFLAVQRPTLYLGPFWWTDYGVPGVGAANGAMHGHQRLVSGSQSQNDSSPRRAGPCDSGSSRYRRPTTTATRGQPRLQFVARK
jgi:hypothetical protein